MTVSPSSSTLAAILCLIEVSRSDVCISRVPFEARMRMPPRTGMVECEAMPFETTESALASEDWLTVKRMCLSLSIYVCIYRYIASGCSKACSNVNKFAKYQLSALFVAFFLVEKRPLF